MTDFVYDSDYAGPRHRYGLTHRPLAAFALPAGWIIQSDRPDARYRYGTVDYPRPLTADEVAAYELTPVPAAPPGAGGGADADAGGYAVTIRFHLRAGDRGLPPDDPAAVRALVRGLLAAGAAWPRLGGLTLTVAPAGAAPPDVPDLLDTLAAHTADGGLDDTPSLRRSTIDGLRAAGVDLDRYTWWTCSPDREPASAPDEDAAE